MPDRTAQPPRPSSVAPHEASRAPSVPEDLIPTAPAAGPGGAAGGLLSRLHGPVALHSYSKQALVILSHAIENELGHTEPGGILLSGFQRLSLLLPELDRYRRLAQRAGAIHVWGVPDVELPGDLPPSMHVHPLAPDSPWRHSWFVVVRAESFWSAVVADEHGSAGTDEAGRTFRGAWSAERAAVEAMLTSLSQEAGLTVEPATFATPSEAAFLDHTLRTQAVGQRLLRHLDRIGAEQRATMVQLRALADRNADLLKVEAGLRHEAERLVDLQRLLSHSAVHDLRGGLSVAMTSLQMVLEGFGGPLTDEQRMLVGTAHESGMRTIDLAQTVLDIARLEAGAFPLDLEPVAATDLREIVEGVVAPRRVLGQSVAVEIPDLLPVLSVDRLIVGRVLANLLENAAKYAAGTLVTVSATATPDSVRIEVRDRGPGVPVRAHEAIFAAFEQAEPGQVALGSGLGLAFCRLAVDALGGTVSLETPPDGGARFVIRLPVPH